MAQLICFLIMYYSLSFICSAINYSIIKKRLQELINTYPHRSIDGVAEKENLRHSYNKEIKFWKKLKAISILTYPISCLLHPILLFLIIVYLVLDALWGIVTEQVQILRS